MPYLVYAIVAYNRLITLLDGDLWRCPRSAAAVPLSAQKKFGDDVMTHHARASSRDLRLTQMRNQNHDDSHKPRFCGWTLPFIIQPQLGEPAVSITTACSAP